MFLMYTAQLCYPTNRKQIISAPRVHTFLSFAISWFYWEIIYQILAENQNFRIEIDYYRNGSIFTIFCTTKPKPFMKP